MTSETETIPKLDSLEYIKMLMIRDGLSVSEAIRKYTNMFGLPCIDKTQRLNSGRAE